jgi:hypothetical protein
MRPVLIILTILTSKVLFCQEIDKAAYADYFDAADSIVTLYYGEVNKAKYLKLDSSKSEFLVLHNHWDNRAKFSEPLTFKPNVFQFRYHFNHPALAKDSFTVTFLLDSSREVMTGFFPHGLFNSASVSEYHFISKQEALKIAKQLKIKKPLKEYEIKVGWEASKGDFKKYRQTKDLRDVVDGKIVWKIKSEYRKPKEGDERPYAEIFVIDAMNGKLLSKEFPYLDWD